MKLSNRLFPAIFIALTSIISSNLYSQECDLQNPINNLNQSLDNFVRAADGGGQVFKAGVTGSLMSLRFADTMCGSSVSFNIRDYVGLGNPYGGAVLASGTASENTWGQFISTLSVTPILNADSYYVIQITSGCPVFTTTNSYDGEIIFTCTPGGSCPGWGEGNGTTGDLMIQTSICPSDEDYQFGCMYESSCNYDPTAQINAGCDYSDCYGCTDETACNFDATSVHDDNSCLELDCAGACGGASVVDCNGDCGGSAYIQCGSCVAGNTGISPIAEDLSFVGGSTYNFVDQSYCEQTFIPSASGILEYIKTHSACSPNFTTLRVETTSGQVLATYSSIATSSAFKTNTSSNPTYLEAGETYIIRVTGGCVRYTNSDIYPGELTLNGYTGWGEDYTQGGDLNISTFYCPAIGGCMDETACNYDEIANADDGSCGLFDDCGVCAGDNSSCGGCTDETACNFDATTSVDDGSCLYIDECGVCGGSGIPEGFCDCNGHTTQNPINNLNQSLDNFVDAADGGGQVFKAGVTGSLMSLRFADTMCGSSVSFNIRDYVGLGNPYGGAVLASGTASENTWGQFISTLSVTPILNADSYYVIQITSGCPVFTTTNSYDGEIIFTCTPGGSCPGWGEGNGTTGDLMIQTSICPSDEDYQFGCMYESSCNYDPTAQINAGCDYSDCYGCTDETACNFDATSVHDDNSCLELDCAGACGGASVVDCNGDCGGSAYIQCGSCVAGNTGISPIAEDLSFVGGSTYNFVDQSYCEQTFIPSASGILEYIKTHSACSPNFTTLRVETTSGQVLATYSSIATSSAFKTNTSSNPTYLEAGETYIIRVTGGCVRYTNSDIYPGELTLNGYTGWGEDYTQGGDLNISTFYCPAIGGCMDETACNYDEIANADDGSCVYINVGECDCDGNILDALNICNGTCLSDADSDGVCDDVDECIGAYDECGVCNGDNSSCSGCIDESACDYDPEAIFQAFTEGSGEGTLIFTWTQTGSYANEVSVTIAGITFNTTNPPTLNLNPGIYTVYGNDSYGDGWNGYVLGVTDVSSGTFTSLTFTTGYSGSVEVEVTSLQETLCTYGAYDECGTCDNDSSNDCEQDCAGNWGGDAVLDECGTCNGEGFAEGTCDCDGNVIDNCGVCGGSDSCCDNLLSVTSMDASCNSLDGSVTASILDCEMTTVSLSPMTQNFLTIVSNAMMMDQYAWDLCSNDGMCYMIEYEYDGRYGVW